MPYYSDFSYFTRAIMLTYLWMYLVFHVWRSERFASLAFSRLGRFELKSVVTVMLLMFIPVQLYYDISMSYVLYSEGFVDLGPPYYIRATPPQLWQENDREFAQSIDFVLMVGFSFQTGTLFLLQSFWNYLAGSVAKHSFMGSLEFKFYLLWTVCTIVMFPLLKYAFNGLDDLSTTIPELAYGISLLILSCLGVLSHFRFKNLIVLIKGDRNSASTTNKLIYFSRTNDFMTTALFVTSLSFIILAVDNLTTEKVIDMNKAATDFLIFNATFCSMAIWFLVIKIVHCPYQLGVASSSSADCIISPQQPRGGTALTASENYCSSINIDANEITSRCTSRNFGQPAMTNLEYDQLALLAPLAPLALPTHINPVQCITNPRYSAVNPIQRPVSYRHYQVGRVEGLRRPASFDQYPAGFHRKSKHNEVPGPFV